MGVLASETLCDNGIMTQEPHNREGVPHFTNKSGCAKKSAYISSNERFSNINVGRVTWQSLIIKWLNGRQFNIPWTGPCLFSLEITNALWCYDSVLLPLCTHIRMCIQALWYLVTRHTLTFGIITLNRIIRILFYI